MGCSWKSIKGRRVRSGPVSSPVGSMAIGLAQIRDIMGMLGLTQVSASPGYTIEDLNEATVRIWLDQEKGYALEAKFNALAPPIIHYISQADANLWEIGRPRPEMIARAFHRASTVQEFN